MWDRKCVLKMKNINYVRIIEWNGHIKIEEKKEIKQGKHFERYQQLVLAYYLVCK